MLLAGAAFPASAFAQCVTDTPAVDACRGGVRLTRPAGATLDLNFMIPGSLPANVTFTRASTATYFDATGTMQTAAANAPRWDYANGVLRGLLIEEARTNVILNSGNIALWGLFGSTQPVVTANQVTAPDGTLTAARVVYPAVSGAGTFSVFSQSVTLSVAAYSFSIWLRGNVGGERVYICATPDGATYYKATAILTTAWQRFSFVTPNLTAVPWFFETGTDLRDATQASTPAQTIYAWGGQVEPGAFPTSAIYTVSATVTRAQDISYLPTDTWFNANTSSLLAEYYYPAGNSLGIAAGISDTVFNNAFWLNGSQAFRATGANPTSGLPVAGAVNRLCGTLTTTQIKVSSNGLAPTGAAHGVAAQTTATRLTVGVSPWALDSPLNGHIRRLQYWPRVLSDAEMQQVTT